MRIVVNLFALLGFSIFVLWSAASLGIGDFYLEYGPHIPAVHSERTS